MKAQDGRSRLIWHEGTPLGSTCEHDKMGAEAVGRGPQAGRGYGDHFTSSRVNTRGLGWGKPRPLLLLVLLRRVSNSLHFYDIFTLGEPFKICLFPSHRIMSES